MTRSAPRPGDDATPTKSGRRVWLGRLGCLLLTLALGLVLTVLGITIAMRTAWGREVARGALTDKLNDAIQGTMGLEEVVELSWSRARLRELTFVDPRGVTVMTVEDATVHLVWSSALRGTVHFDRATTRGVTLLVAHGESRSTSLADTFAASHRTSRERAAGEGLRVLMDRVSIEDAAVRVRMGAPIALHVSSAVARLDHDPARRPRGERATEVELRAVYANLSMDGRDAISGTDIRAAGSVYDLRARVCHGRGLIAVRVLVAEEGGAQLIYSTHALLMRMAMRIASRRASVSMRPGGVDLRGVPRCGPPPA